MAGKMFGAIKGLIFKPSDDELTEQTQQKQDNTIKSVAASTTIIQHSSVNQSVLKELLSAIKDSGKNYVKFINMAKSMENVIPDMATRFNAAFVPLSQAGLTKQDILQGINERQSAIVAEREQFQETLKEENDSIADMKKEMTIRETTIENLQKQIVGLQNEKETISKNIDTELKHIESITASFEKAAEVATQELTDIQSKVNNYLK